MEHTESMDTAIEKASNMAPQLARLMDTLPDKYKKSLEDLAQKANPSKRGLSDEQAVSSWNPPSIRVYQPTTRNTGGLEDLRQGDLFTGTGDNLGKELEFIVLYRYITHTRWNAGEFSGAPNCSSPGILPGHERLSVFGDKCDDCPDLPFRDGKRTLCGKNMVYWVMDAKNMDSIYSVQFSKTSYNTGSKLYRLARSQPLTWSKTFKLAATKVENSRGVYFNLAVTMGGDTDEHQQAIADAFCTIIHDQRTAMLRRLIERREEAVDGNPEDMAVETEESSAEPDFNM